MSEKEIIKPFKITFECSVDTIPELRKLLKKLNNIPFKHNLYNVKIGVKDGEIPWSQY